MGAEQPSRRLSYGEYLRLEEMLALQEGPDWLGREFSNNELHFVVVHQAFELWFRLIIRELTELRDLLNRDNIPESDMPKAVHHMDRVTEIFNLLASQWRVMETMSPQEFLEFRDGLGSSSGFESWQMRHIELLLGLEDSQRIGGMDPMKHFQRLVSEGAMSSHLLKSLEQVAAAPSLKDVVYEWLSRTPIDGSVLGDDEELVKSYAQNHVEAMTKHAESTLEGMVAAGGEEEKLRPRLFASVEHAKTFLGLDSQVNRGRIGLLFIESHRQLPLLAWPRRLIDGLVALEESTLLFRAHHARMVERMIGRRMGTGGSAGVDYLDETTKYRIFTDLWEVRTILLKKDLLPQLTSPEFYGFSAEN